MEKYWGRWSYRAATNGQRKSSASNWQWRRSECLSGHYRWKTVVDCHRSTFCAGKLRLDTSSTYRIGTPVYGSNPTKRLLVFATSSKSFEQRSDSVTQ